MENKERETEVKPLINSDFKPVDFTTIRGKSNVEFEWHGDKQPKKKKSMFRKGGRR